MIDFPLDGLLEEQACLQWLERHLHPAGLRCPRCGQAERRRARQEGRVPSYRCRACDRYYTVLTGTAFAKTHQAASTLVLMLRGIAKGEPTARLAREVDVSRKQMHTLRHRVQMGLYETRPTDVLDETGPGASETSEAPAFEADELYQNAGEKRSAPYPPVGSAAPPGQQAPGPRHL